MTDTTGSPTAAYAYDSFGNLITQAGQLTNPFRYTARELDSETGLYYYRARYYDSATGRFLSEDAIMFESGQINIYTYVGNSPTGLVDPSGEYARLNSKSDCAQVFAQALKTGLCAGDFADAFNRAASKVPIYTVRSPNSPASNLTEDAVSKNGVTQTLGNTFFGNYINPPNAFTLTNGRKPAILLGPGYFSDPYLTRVATLIHEEFHAVTFLNDADVFNIFRQYGLSNTQFRLWPYPTFEFTQWIEKGCPK